jgi:tetratricopeptide (TPR) repeat protein
MVKQYKDWDWAGAEQAFKRTLKLNPSLSDAHAHYAWHLELMGRRDEAWAEAKRAQQVDPLTPLWTAWLGWLYWYAGQYEQAIVEAQKSLELNPNFPDALWVLGGVYADQGMFEDAIALHKKLGAANPIWRFTLARTYAMAGQEDEAQKILAGLAKERMNAWPLAIVYTALGDKDEAFRWLEKGIEYPPHNYIPWIGKEPAFSPLRDDPRLQDLLQRMNLPE